MASRTANSLSTQQRLLSLLFLKRRHNKTCGVNQHPCTCKYCVTNICLIVLNLKITTIYGIALITCYVQTLWKRRNSVKRFSLIFQTAVCAFILNIRTNKSNHSLYLHFSAFKYMFFNFKFTIIYININIYLSSNFRE